MTTLCQDSQIDTHVAGQAAQDNRVRSLSNKQKCDLCLSFLSTESTTTVCLTSSQRHTRGELTTTVSHELTTSHTHLQARHGKKCSTESTITVCLTSSQRHTRGELTTTVSHELTTSHTHLQA